MTLPTLLMLYWHRTSSTAFPHTAFECEYQALCTILAVYLAMAYLTLCFYLESWEQGSGISRIKRVRDEPNERGAGKIFSHASRLR